MTVRVLINLPRTSRDHLDWQLTLPQLVWCDRVWSRKCFTMNQQIWQTDRQCLKAENKKKRSLFHSQKNDNRKERKYLHKKRKCYKSTPSHIFFMDFFVLLNLTPVGRCHRLFSPLLDFFWLAARLKRKTPTDYRRNLIYVRNTSNVT